MCSRFGFVKYDHNELEQRFHLMAIATDQPLPFPLYNIAPTDLAPVVVETDNKRQLEFMHFGLIPHWAKDPKIAASCLNARAETVAEKPSFRTPFKKRRCLVLTDGYYEWKPVGKKKLPYRITLKNEKPFALAGLWDIWKRPDGADVKTFSIITTEGNSLTAAFHDRMPVILEPENEPLWLAPSVTEERTLKPLLKAYSPDQMKMAPASYRLNSPRNKDAAILTPDPELL